MPGLCSNCDFKMYGNSHQLGESPTEQVRDGLGSNQHSSTSRVAWECNLKMWGESSTSLNTGLRPIVQKQYDRKLKRPLERDLKVPEAKTQYSSAHYHSVKDKSYKGVEKGKTLSECAHSHVGLMVYKIVSETRLSSYFGINLLCARHSEVTQSQMEGSTLNKCNQSERHVSFM